MIFSGVGIIINIMTIFALTSKSIKKEMKKQYLYFVLHSYSNIFNMIIIAMSLINECKLENIFCSSLYGSDVAQYFEMIFNILIRNILKTFSNLAFLAFVIARYTKISSTKNFVLKKFDTLSLKMFSFLALILSIFVNSYIYFEIQVKQKFKYLDTINQDSSQDQFRTDFTDTETTVFTSLQYLKLILTDLLIFALTIAIDCYLICFIKKSMINSGHNREVKKKAKQRTIIMLILNGINFLLLRLPSTLIGFYGLFFNYKTKSRTETQYYPNVISYLVCRVFKFCDSLEQAFYFLYLLSFLVQFFIFYKLDSNFKAGCQSLKFCKKKETRVA